MNEGKEWRAFQDYLVANATLTTGAIALRHALAGLHQRTYWKKEFNAPTKTVQILTCLSKQGISDARQLLVKEGLIIYQKGARWRALVYEMVSLTQVGQYFNGDTDQILDQSEIDTKIRIDEMEMKKIQSLFLNRISVY